MPQVVLTAAPYRPSLPVTGSEMVLYRAANLVCRGRLPFLYLEGYAGSLDMEQPIPTENLTGTISFNFGASLEVTGTGTAFLDELHLGQMILCEGNPIVVKRLVSQELFIADRLPISIETNATAEICPIIFALDNDIGSLLRGNAIKYDKGTILAVGAGELRVNGEVLAGESLVATRRAQIATYDATTETYAVEDLGFDDVPSITNSAITVVASGGTKNMSLGYYSFMLAYYSDITSGYGNPTDVLLSGGTAGYQITVANSTFQIDKSADTPPSKATGYIIYATAYRGSSTLSQTNAIQGPWYELKRVPFTDFTANLYAFDYVDADLSTTFATQDNDPPPDAEYITSLAGFVNMVSTNGAGVNTAGREASTSPGPMVSPMSAYNVDAFPAGTRIPTEGGETIIGCVSAAGRLFPMTPNSLQATTPTGLPTVPMTLRPFWKKGFVSPYNLTFLDDTLYGYSGNQLFRSIATGDSADAGYQFSTDVEQQMAESSGGYVVVEVDAKNQQVCVFLSAVRQNDEGYWVTDVYPFSPAQGWQPKIELSSDTRDMIVTSAANVNGGLYFLAGGRRAGDTVQFDTFKWDTESGLVTDTYASWSYMDNGVEIISKVLHKIRSKGKFPNGATVQVYAVSPGSQIDVDGLSTGDDPFLEFSLDTSTEVYQYAVEKIRAHNCLMWTVRVSAPSLGDDPVQLHEFVVDLSVAGQER